MSFNLEKYVFNIFLTIGMLYQLVQLITVFLLPIRPTLGLGEATLTLIMYVFCLILVQRFENIRTLSIVIFIIAFLSLSFEWIFFGGFKGSSAYNGLFIMLSIPLIFNSNTRLVLLCLFLFNISILLFFDFYKNWNIIIYQYTPSEFLINVDFIIHAALISVMLLLLKNKFSSYRTKVKSTNSEIETLHKQIQEQNRTLREQEEEIKSLNDNLEKIIKKRTEEAFEKNILLEEYAFINAHLLRGPLCRILGLLNLIELETDSSETIELKQNAEKLDGILRKINEIVA